VEEEKKKRDLFKNGISVCVKTLNIFQEKEPWATKPARLNWEQVE